MKYLFIPLLFFLSACGQHHPEEQAIEKLLHQQAAAWNNGDLTQYMELGYWHNDSLVFIGSRGPTYGFDATLSNYKKSYPTNEKMGQLHFSNLKMKRLSATYYYVIGSWALERKDGDLKGHFSLLFKKINSSWKIIADHSS